MHKLTTSELALILQEGEGLLIEFKEQLPYEALRDAVKFSICFG